MIATPSAANSCQADSLADLVDRLTVRLQAGETINRDALLAEYPRHADELERLLPAIAVLADLSRSGEAQGAGAAADSDAVPGTLGDFRIIREVGRGGMGVVYEAEQISLSRRVALKVLPFAATMDSKQLQRFHNEAKAAASLHHEHIVPVYGVGCERGVNYYAMQFIDGTTLAQVIAGRQTLHSPSPIVGEARHPAPSPLVGEGRGGGFVDATGDYRPGAESPTSPVAALSTALTDPKGRSFYRTAAETIAQAAEALEYAHSMGIVHRDVKPGNLMVDAAGKLWVADFGLARFGTDAGLTMSGDLLGTLRYMAPEQAMARHGLADHRVDVYGLGCTFYELLTGKPAVDAADKADILRHIAFEEPVAPRKLDKAIPAELETITLKCLAKNPNERYATEGELAADLRRFREDQPIRARPPSLSQRILRCGRRHRAVTASATAAVIAAVVMLAGAAGWVSRDRASRLAETKRSMAAALEEADHWEGLGRWPDALAPAKRAADLIGDDDANDMAALARRRRDDLAMVVRLDHVLQEMNVTFTGSDFVRGDRLFAEAFRDYGIDVDAVGPDEVATHLPQGLVRTELVAGLDDWARVRRTGDKGGPEAGWRRILAAAAASDPDPWHNHVRDAWASADVNRLKDLIASAPLDRLHPSALMMLVDKVPAGDAVTVLRDAQHRRPGDFRINLQLGVALGESKPKRTAEVIEFFRAALAIRPGNPGALTLLAASLADVKRTDEALMVIREAIRRLPVDKQGKPVVVMAGFMYQYLGGILDDKGAVDEADAAFRESLRFAPDSSFTLNLLGRFLCDRRKDYDGAEAAFHRAIELNRSQTLNSQVHFNLGRVLALKGNHLGAIAAYREAIRLDPNDAQTHCNLGIELSDQGKRDEAIACYREAIRLETGLFEGHYNLGLDLSGQGKRDEAIACYRQAIRLKPDYADAHYDLGVDLSGQGKWDEAIACYREAIRLKPDYAAAHFNLGNRLSAQGKWDEAIRCYREVIRLKADHAQCHNALGRLLVTCPEERLRDRRQAVVHAQNAVELKPNEGRFWSTLGMVRYRNGEWQAAVEALTKSTELRKGGDATDFFFLAMSYERLGDKKQAREWYDKAIGRMDKNKPQDEELRRLRAEAAELLGLSAQPDS